MKKYIPYIVILLLTYLLIAFVKMQFNPAYWKTDERLGLLYASLCAMTMYPIVRFMIKDLKE